MFFNREDFPFTAVLESRWQTIRREFEQIPPKLLIPWPEKEIYSGCWDVFGLWGAGQRFDANCRLCPATSQIVESIAGLTTAGFSQMAPGARIHPHVGYTDTVLRCHLGLIVPENCGLQVGDQMRRWHEGKCLVFDDTARHHAWNDSQELRTVLIVDFVRPGRVFDDTISAEAAGVIDQRAAPRS